MGGKPSAVEFRACAGAGGAIALVAPSTTGSCDRDAAMVIVHDRDGPSTPER